MPILTFPFSDPASSRQKAYALARWTRSKAWVAITLLSVSASALCAPTAPAPFFDGVLHARSPHGVYTDIRFEPHRLVAQVHGLHVCVLHAHLIHGDPHISRYAIEPPQGGRFCDELVDGEIVIHPHSTSDVMAEFKSPRIRWSGSFTATRRGAERDSSISARSPASGVNAAAAWWLCCTAVSNYRSAKAKRGTFVRWPVNQGLAGE